MRTIEELLHRRSDLSTFVVHFTRDTPSAGGKSPIQARDNLLNILQSRRLEARNTFGLASELSTVWPEVAETQQVVCFTETPLEHAWMMCEEIGDRNCQFNGYGIAFTRTFARRYRVNPVWYLDITSGQGIPGGRDWLTTAVKSLLDAAKEAATDPYAGINPATLANAPILRLTPFIETMGKPADVRKEFWWEREWRHVGDMTFDITDIVVIFAPFGDHGPIRAALADNYPGKTPALIDATWGLERMIGTLAGVTDLDPFPQ